MTLARRLGRSLAFGCAFVGWVGCGGDDSPLPGSGGERGPVAFEVVAPPPHGPFPDIDGSVWTRGDTVVLNRYVSFDRRVTWRALELVPEGRLPADFVFLSDTTGVARTGQNAFTLVDLEAGTYRGLSGERADLSGWAVHEGYLYHFVEEVTEGGSIDDERATAFFFRLNLGDVDATWETLPTLATTYTPLRFRPSLHATDVGLVVVTRFGFYTSVDGGQTWGSEPAVPSGLGGALGDLNPVRVTPRGSVLIVQGPNTVASYDGGATYETIGQNPGPSVDWTTLEILPDGTLALPRIALRSDDEGRTWRPILEDRPPGRVAYLRGHEVYLSGVGPTLVARADGEVEMLVARAPDEPSGGRLDAVSLASGDILGLVSGQQIRIRPGQHAWTWEREWVGADRLFVVGEGRLALTTAPEGSGRPPTIAFSEDGGVSWSEPVALPVAVPVERLVALPDRLLAYLAGRDVCGSTLLESLDRGTSWSPLPPVATLIDSDGVSVAEGFLDHAPIATTSDGVVFGSSAEYFPVGSECNYFVTYPSRSDDAGRTWVAIGAGVRDGARGYLPIATTARDDLVVGAFFTDGPVTDVFLEVWLFRRDAERWVEIGVPRLPSGPLLYSGFPTVAAQVSADDRLQLTTSWGIVRSVAPLR
ncbi:MAG: hypothetical protein H6722_33450 [Sandaracinus sp.]|nr:hypothetical protein [Sandaracinus sp.]MCB9617365.1 hypothetical protein [Sandaracinus sp.]